MRLRSPKLTGHCHDASLINFLFGRSASDRARCTGTFNSRPVGEPGNIESMSGPQEHPAGWFPTTHWTAVLTAADSRAPRGTEALETLCRAYWFPLYAFVRRQGHGPTEAQDLTQDFFAHLLSSDALSSVDPSKGRFRSFLLASLRNLLANEWRHGQRQKRGGGANVFSLDAVEAEERYRLEPADGATPESIYERKWAEALLERVLARLRDECDASGRTQRFDTLKVFLLEDKGTLSLADAASCLGLTVVAVKGVIHRLRQRYREIFREEVAHTVERVEEVDEEIRHLLNALAGTAGA
jgi:RNA polymerase sigma factor (sigma-70 family)